MANSNGTMRAARVVVVAAVVADRGVDHDEEMGKGERTSAIARKFWGSRASQGRATLTNVRNCKEKEREKEREKKTIRITIVCTRRDRIELYIAPCALWLTRP